MFTAVLPARQLAHHGISRVARCCTRFAGVLGICFLLQACCRDCAHLSQVGALSARGPVAAPLVSKTPESAPGLHGSAGGDLPDMSTAQDGSPDGGDAVGAGIYVNDGGDVLTTWEQIASCGKVAILDDYEFRAATVVAGNPVRGLALLRTGQPTLAYATFRSLGASGGTTIHAFAYPVTDGVPLPLVHVPGLLRDTTSPDGIVGILQSSAVIDNQSPGGPIVDQYGDVLGIVVTKLEQDWPADYSYGIGSVPISQFALAANVDIRMRLANLPIGNDGSRDLVQAVSDYIVLVICFR